MTNINAPEDRRRVLRAALRVRSDLRTGTQLADTPPPRFEITPAVILEDQGYLVWWSIGHLGARGTFVGNEVDEDLVAYMMVDELCDEMAELLVSKSVTVASTWPLCPAHEHSLSLIYDEGEAAWACRDDANIRCKLGRLRTIVRHVEE